MPTERPLMFVRPAEGGDVNELIDIDIKCFEAAWTADEWRQSIQDDNRGVAVLTYFGSVIGFAAYAPGELFKLAVKPRFRLMGGSRLLLQPVCAMSRNRALKQVATIVPESMVYLPTGLWLIKVGFRATAPFHKDHFHLLGTAEDGVKCVLGVVCD